MESFATDALERHYNKLLSTIHKIKSYQSANVRVAKITLLCIYQLETGIASANLEIEDIREVESFYKWIREYLQDLVTEANLINQVICSKTGDDPQPIAFFEGGKR